MTYRGTVKDGVIVLDALEQLPEGADVFVRIEDAPMTAEEKAIIERQREALLRLVEAGEKIGQVLPTDASRNVDHYLYQAPKQ